MKGLITELRFRTACQLSESSCNESTSNCQNDAYIQEEEITFDDFGFPRDTRPPLEIYGTDLTVLAAEGKLEECFGREKELFQLMEILVRRQKNNPVLVGNAGVGKTSIIELFACRIVNRLVPFVLGNRTIISLDLTRMISGSKYRGEFELRLQSVLDAVLANPTIIVFIDEIHNIIGAGNAEGSNDAANILKPILSRTGFQCIGATTGKEYEKIEKDPALNRRFQPINVFEPSIDDTIKIIYGLLPKLETFHNVTIMPEAIRQAVELTAHYISDRFLPDKAIDVIDRAGAREVIRLTSVEEKTVIEALARTGLKNVSILRGEAFRRGDIATEFILQEVENAYYRFILKWCENPRIIPTVKNIRDLNEEELEELTGKPILTPITEGLFEQMRNSVLIRVDQLMFKSTNLRSVIRPIRRISDLSILQNESVYAELAMSFVYDKIYPQSIYRVGAIFNYELLDFQRLYEEIPYLPYLKEKFLGQMLNIARASKMTTYLGSWRNLLKSDPLCYSKEQDFEAEDIEEYEQAFLILSEIEENRIQVFKEFLSILKPVLRRSVIRSLEYGAGLDPSREQQAAIYALLGYFSTETGCEYLANMDDPEILRIARKTANYGEVKTRITPRKIRTLLSEITGVPLQTISEDESKKLANIEKTLHTRVIGQNFAIKAIAKAIKRARLGLHAGKRPIASFLFCGPTGVGKTEAAKALAECMYGSESNLLRFDMSEFRESHSYSRLIGAPKGYLGYGEGGQLTNAVRKKPNSVILFDEIEKAHPDVLNLFLQILDDGRLTDTESRLISFENTIIIMTSNVAAEEIQKALRRGDTLKAELESELNIDLDLLETESVELDDSSASTEKPTVTVYEDPYAGPIKFLQSPIKENFLTDINKQMKLEFKKNLLRKDYGGLNSKLYQANEARKKLMEKLDKELKDSVLDRLKRSFLPEFLNRFDEIIPFHPIKLEELEKICEIMVREVVERIKAKNIILDVKEDVKRKLTQEGYDPLFGARPLRRMVTRYVEDPVAEVMLNTLADTRKKEIELYLDENGIVTTRLINANGVVTTRQKAKL